MDQNNTRKSKVDLGNTQFFKVHDPVNQIVGYIMSGDPTYITNYMGARSLIMKVERDELVEEIMNDYIAFNHWDEK